MLEQRLQLAFNRIQELQNQKLDFKDYVKFEQKTELGVSSLDYRMKQADRTLRNTIDYMLRY